MINIMKDIYIQDKRLWQVWPGKNRFCCSGKCMTGPKSDLLYYIPSIAALIVIPNTFFIFAAPYIWQKVTVILPILSVILYLLTLSAYILTTFTDPGIIPRKTITEIIDHESSKIDIMSIDMSKYCSTCQIFRPRRSHHCKVCDNCVEIFDHHCPYINNCIGGRNYIFFFLFILNLTLLCLTNIAGCFIFIFHDYSISGPAKETFIKQGTVSLIIIVIIIVLTTMIGILTTILCLHHICLCFTGETTKERIKGEDIGSHCYFCKKKPKKFDPQQILTEEQFKKIVEGPVFIEMSDNENSVSN
ncbi:hypothetical protein SteCoe_1851 [Stentor coeruleus]|uniref:Palmitoyltransferase n=1 Tax=Stentor coeruleus TaxID=5963 RepID=A0A1R2D0Q6_9CILI|nr:hypothetical protein SteCoe_1851 [Stentor coeruleus]